MSKIIILGDTHLGARSGSTVFADYFNKFFADQLYTYMVDNDITTIFQLGDLFDNRTALPMRAFDMSKPIWFDPLVEHGFTMHTLLGNHDIALRDSLRINTPENVLKDYISSGHIVVYKKPTQVIAAPNTTFDIIPWICKENYDEVMAFIKRKKISDICLGHFEIEGASMYKGVPSHGGLNQELFERYEAVLSGHYHTRSFLDGNRINYVGTPYELTWMDAHDPRGFTVFDTETRLYEFVHNPETMHAKVYYYNINTEVPQDLGGKFVKLIVEAKDDLKHFDKFLASLRVQNPLDLTITENLESLNDGSIDDDTIDVKDTMAMISKYIDSLETEIDKDRVKAYINGLYIEAASQ